MTGRDFEYTIRELDGWRRVFAVDLDGGVFVSNLSDFTTVFDKVRISKPRDIILNCEKLDFISSSGIGALMKMHGELNGAGARLWIAGLDQEILRVFKQMNLDSVFRLEPDLNDALDRIKKMGFPQKNTDTGG